MKLHIIAAEENAALEAYYARQERRHPGRFCVRYSWPELQDEERRESVLTFRERLARAEFEGA